MATVAAYWRPTSIDEAFDLLDRPGTVVLGGGTGLNGAPPGDPVEVVDLQALHLDGTTRGPDDELLVGAMTTLQQLADSDHAPTSVREAARRELPSTLRNQATVGGCIASGDSESELLATLLVHEAVVEVEGRTGSEQMHLDALLASLPLAPGRIVTAVTIHTSGRAAAARTARTPADRPIVAAVVRQAGGVTHKALTGVARTPVLVETADDVEPTGDFRGSAEYRRSLAATLLARATSATEAIA